MTLVSKAVILAAGRGTRMRELTNEVPKPMVKVRGRPVLDYIVSGLVAAGIREILLVVGYRKEAVRDYFGTGTRHQAAIEYVEQVVQDGTGKVVELARSFCGADAFVLSYGDILIDPAFYVPLSRLEDQEMTIAVRHTNDVSKGGAVYLNDRFELVDLREKPPAGQAETHWYNAGIYTFRASIFPYCARLKKSPRGEYELTDAIRALAHDGKKVLALEIKGAWTDVRDPEVLAELNRE
jgi:dTDP-glucose pyrophosphorylase